MATLFLARTSADGRAFAQPVPDASTPMEAAILFAECWGAGEASGEVAITVTDSETGHEQCFRIDLGDHTIGPC
ncbi:MAG TPA: DUF5961 family protein [Caulobacteraceae bacterium]|jgi:hypothetical protein|nr:DUF5961 family protein [Caulobacteraceae bacterium]